MKSFIQQLMKIFLMQIVPLNIQEMKHSKKKLSVCCKAENLYLLQLYGIILQYIFAEW